MCIHHWYIQDDERYHQIGICQKCKGIRDFGINPTIVTDKWLITTDYFLDSFTGKLKKKTRVESREYGYPKPPGTWIDNHGGTHYPSVIPFEPPRDDDLGDSLKHDLDSKGMHLINKP